MADENITRVRRGQAIRLNNDVCVVTDIAHKTPPNLSAFVQVSAKSIAHGKTHSLRMTPNDKVDVVPLYREEYEYSYKDGDGYHFLHPESFEDVIVPDTIIAEVRLYLMENARYVLLFTDETVATIELPPAMNMLVAEAPDGVKGDSANNVYKSAVMDTGLTVQVPLFIKTGETIRIKTEDGSYLGRA